MPYGFNDDKSKYDLTGKADASHTHAASDIASGTLAAARIPSLAASKITSGTLDSDRLPTVPISKGGTGKTTAKAAQNALLSDMNELTGGIGDDLYVVMPYESNSDRNGAVHKRKWSVIWTWIASKIRSVFGFTSSNILPAANGGTGHTTLQATRNAMGLGNTTNALPVANGGTGQTTAADAWDALGGGDIGKKDSLAASDIPSLAASKITSGTFNSDRLPTVPIAKGGTGQTAVTHETTVANVISAASGVSITGAVYSVWGKVVQLNLSVTATSAKSGTWTVGTVVSGKRPYSQIFGTSNLAAIEAVQLMSAGTLQVNGALAASGTVQLSIMYLLP